jgi:hypothetical protein
LLLLIESKERLYWRGSSLFMFHYHVSRTFS